MVYEYGACRYCICNVIVYVYNMHMVYSIVCWQIGYSYVQYNILFVNGCIIRFNVYCTIQLSGQVPSERIRESHIVHINIRCRNLGIYRYCLCSCGMCDSRIPSDCTSLQFVLCVTYIIRYVLLLCLSSNHIAKWCMNGNNSTGSVSICVMRLLCVCVSLCVVVCNIALSESH